MRDVLLIVITLFLCVRALSQPFVGALAFVFFGLFNPQSMTWGFAQTAPLSQCLVIATCVGYLSSTEMKTFPWQRELGLLLILWGLFCVTTLFAFSPERAFVRLGYVSKIFFMIFLATSLTNTKERAFQLIQAIAWALGLYALKAGVWVVLSGGNFIVWGPERSFLEANNAIGMAFAMNMPLLLFLLKTEQVEWRKWLLRSMLVASYPAVMCTFSRGAWLGLFVATIFFVLRSRRKFVLMSMGVVGAVILLPLLPTLMPERVISRYGQLVDYEEEGSAQSRFWNWEFCRRVGFARPVLGAGFSYYSKEAYAIYFPEFLERYPDKQWSCHSTWFSIFGEHGFTGFFIWLCLIVRCFLSLRKIRRYGYAQTDSLWYVHLADMLQIAIIVYLVVGTFYDAAYFDLFYYLIATAYAVTELTYQRGTNSVVPQFPRRKILHPPSVETV